MLKAAAIVAALVTAGVPAVTLAQAAADLLNDGKNTENVTTFGMGYDLKMYSPLRQINTSNVKRLVPIWSFSLSNDMGELSQPTVYNGVMYVVNGNWTFAIDLATGRQIWRTPAQYDRGELRVGTAGAIMRGPASPVRRPGLIRSSPTPGNMAARPRGSTVRTTRNWISFISAPGTRSRTTRCIAPAWIVCTPPAYSRSGQKLASWSGITSTCRT